YPEYLAPSNEEVPVEDQPYAVVDSPIALSPGYVADSDPKEDPKEDSEDGPVDYLADGGDGDDDDSSDDDYEEEEASEEEEAEEEDEEHLALADSVVAPVVDHVPSSEEIEPFETDESAPTPRSPQTIVPFSQTCLRRARNTVRLEPPMSPSMEARIAEYAVAPTPPSLHLPPHVPTSVPLPLSPLPPLPASLLIPPPVDRREDTPEAELPPCKRLCLTTLTSRYEVGESSIAAPRPAGGHRIDYGFIGTLDAKTRRQRAEEGYKTHAWMQDHCIDAQDSLIAALTAQVSSLQGHLATTLGEIRALQARDQARADAPEDTASTVVGLVISFLVSDNHNNMPPRKSSAAARAAAPMTTAVVEQLIEARVSAALGTEGVVVLAQWFEKMESVFHISNCAVENQVKFATCTFVRNALTWWNSHMKVVTQDVAYAMDWKTLKKMMTVKYCPRGEIKKLEIELWNLKVKGTDITSYTLRFQELALMCGCMFPEESDEVEKYVGGLPDMIRGNVMQAEQKRKLKYNAGNNQGHQQQNKRQNTGRDYTAGPGKKRSTRDHCPCVQNATITTKGHVLPGVINARRSAIWLVTVGVLVPMGHFKRDYPRLKNKNYGNQGGNGNASAKVYVVGNAGTSPDSNVVMHTFLLNNCYASILFDIGADRSFVSTTFSSLIDITPTTLDHYYDVELADGKIIGINTIIRDCTLNFLDHPFNINLMPVELGSFDVIVRMDWLAKYHAVIDYAEKIIRVPWGNETLIIHGDESSRGNETLLNIISCTKTHKYLLKGHHVFL
ncbi:putative reverse transcriptase domain-containing protein, partial [Tanacetum coccineum]